MKNKLRQLYWQLSEKFDGQLDEQLDSQMCGQLKEKYNEN